MLDCVVLYLDLYLGHAIFNRVPDLKYYLLIIAMFFAIENRDSLFPLFPTPFSQLPTPYYFLPTTYSPLPSTYYSKSPMQQQPAR